MSEWSEKLMGELCPIKKISVNPSKNADTLFHVYSLPAFDDGKRPEQALGKEIMSGKFAVKPGMILYNKLNVRFRRIWYIGERVNESSICSTEFLPLVPNKCDQGFMYYFLLTQNFTDTMDSSHTGTSGSHQRIDVGFFSNQLVSIPLSRQEQHNIAEVLFSLDDKIEQLNRNNATLEALAQTYFRQWFLEDNGNGPIPVSDMATLENNSVNPGRQPLEPFFHYSIPAFDNAQMPVVELGKAILSNKFCVLPSTILISKLNPVTPRIWRIGEAVQSNSVCSTEFQVLKPKDMRHYFFLYCLMKSNDVISSFTMSATGTSGSHQRIRPEYILEVETPEPDKDKLSLFNEICTPMMERVKKNQKQIQTLQKLRNTLLPKIISGEVKVKL